MRQPANQHTARGTPLDHSTPKSVLGKVKPANASSTSTRTAAATSAADDHTEAADERHAETATRLEPQRPQRIQQGHRHQARTRSTRHSAPARRLRMPTPISRLHRRSHRGRPHCAARRRPEAGNRPGQPARSVPTMPSQAHQQASGSSPETEGAGAPRPASTPAPGRRAARQRAAARAAPDQPLGGDPRRRSGSRGRHRARR